jgi:ribose transport system permease protein
MPRTAPQTSALETDPVTTGVDDPATSAPRAPRGGKGRGGELLSRYAAVLVLVLLCLLFSVLLPDTFPTYNNLVTLLTTQEIVVILAIGTMIPLAAGQFDLSVGYVLGIAAMETAVLSSHGVSIGLVMPLVLLSGVVIGIVNGLLVVHVGISAFIATLGTGTILSGIQIWISNDSVVFENISPTLLKLGRSQFLDLPLPVFYMIAVVLVMLYVMDHTPLGRYFYAIGGGPSAARLAGLPVNRLTILAFVGSGALAALAGILSTATTGAAQPGVGPEFLLPAFAAAFLGATTIRPGRFNVLGTVVALFLLAVGIAGLNQLGAPFWISPVFNGAALLFAVALARTRATA